MYNLLKEIAGGAGVNEITVVGLLIAGSGLFFVSMAALTVRAEKKPISFRTVVTAINENYYGLTGPGLLVIGLFAILLGLLFSAFGIKV